MRCLLLCAALLVPALCTAAAAGVPDSAAPSPGPPRFSPLSATFAASPTARFEANATAARCGEAHANVSRLYADLPSVLVLRWRSRLINGMGNTLFAFTRQLAVGALMGRATFLERNDPDCGEPGRRACASDPGAYFAGQARAARRARRRRG